MSHHDAGAAPDDKEELQFDHAEYDAPTAVECVACKQPVADVYYEINGRLFCAPCREGVDAYLATGSGAVRFLRALLFGGAAAVGGFLIYFGVMKLANMEIGLISILVGFMVGQAVRKGSNQRGGWRYQGLALFLTYSAIAASYSAQFIPELIAGAQKKQAANEAAPQAPGAAAKPGVAAPAEAPAAVPPPPKAQGPLLVLLAKFLLMSVVLCYALPIVVGIQQPIGLLIVAFALWEAWKLNRRVPLQFNGPFQVNPPPDLEELPPDGVPSHA